MPARRISVDPEAFQRARDLLQLVGHPVRLDVLADIGQHGTRSPNAIADCSPATLGTVAYHVRLLASWDLIELDHETRVRGAIEHHYRLTRAGREILRRVLVLAGASPLHVITEPQEATRAR